MRRLSQAARAPAALLAAATLAGCAGDTARRDAASHFPERAPRLVELLHGVRADPDLGIVEFDAEVAIDCHDPETPDVYLEVVCCVRDTREHEALVVTSVPSSYVHAALLAAGAEPGHPGSWREQGGTLEPVAPAGTAIRVVLVTKGPDGTEVEHDPAAWIVHAEDGRTLREVLPESGWVFAGSRMREHEGREVYDADWTGQLVGLHTFGSETVAWTRVASPDSWIEEPQWLANAAAVPAFGAPVTVRLRVVPGSP